MKVAVVYTSTTPELIELVEKELHKTVGEDVELISSSDPSILAEVREAGYVTAPATARLVSMFMDAVEQGADVVMNACSSVGDVADSAQDVAKLTGVPIVRIDEEMCRAAVRSGKRIGVMATLSSTLEPTKNTVLRVAREMGKRVELVDALLEGAFGLSPDEFKQRMLDKAGEIAQDVDVILFAQGSMAYCEQIIADTYHKEVVSSPRFGAIDVRKALEVKGLI